MYTYIIGFIVNLILMAVIIRWLPIGKLARLVIKTAENDAAKAHFTIMIIGGPITVFAIFFYTFFNLIAFPKEKTIPEVEEKKSEYRDCAKKES